MFVKQNIDLNFHSGNGVSLFMWKQYQELLQWAE